MENKIEVKISKTYDGGISVDTKIADGVSDTEVVNLLLDFVNSLLLNNVELGVI